MSKVSVHVRIPLKAGSREAAVAFFEAALPNVLAEDGTELYLVHVDDNDPNVLYVHERYTSMDGFNAHVGAGWFQDFFAGMAEFIEGTPELKLIRPVAGKGL